MLLPELMLTGVVDVGALLCCSLCSIVANNAGAATSGRGFFFNMFSEASTEAGAEYPVGTIVGSLA